jgi:MscS family membrane protein
MPRLPDRPDRVSSHLMIARIFAIAALIAACWLPMPAGPAGAPLAWAAGFTDKADQAVQHPEEATLQVADSLLQQLRLPDVWRQNGPKQWLILLGVIFLGLVAGWIVAAVLARLARRFEQRGWSIWTHVLRDLVAPAKLALIALGLALGLAQIKGMSATLQDLWVRVLLFLYAVAGFWYAFNLVSVADVLLRRATAKTESTLDDQVVPLIRKTLRIFIVVVAVMFVVDSVFEQDIAAWLAGLGIAGLAVSLAAQDSLKNLFGSITILFDRPFKVGERIVYAGYDGIVEEIGFRSTKVRTLTGHLVTIPNAKIVSDAVENIGRRPSIQRTMNVTITYDTPREKIQRAVDILRGILEEEDLRGPIHPVINGSEFPPRVYFNDYNAESLNILVVYWYVPPAYWDYLEHAQRLNLRVFEEFEKAGIEFAFPTQTVYLAGDPKRQLALKMLGRGL